MVWPQVEVFDGSGTSCAVIPGEKGNVFEMIYPRCLSHSSCIKNASQTYETCEHDDLILKKYEYALIYDFGLKSKYYLTFAEPRQ